MDANLPSVSGSGAALALLKISLIALVSSEEMGPKHIIGG